MPRRYNRNIKAKPRIISPTKPRRIAPYRGRNFGAINKTEPAQNNKVATKAAITPYKTPANIANTYTESQYMNAIAQGKIPAAPPPNSVYAGNAMAPIYYGPQNYSEGQYYNAIALGLIPPGPPVPSSTVTVPMPRVTPPNIRYWQRKAANAVGAPAKVVHNPPRTEYGPTIPETTGVLEGMPPTQENGGGYTYPDYTYPDYTYPTTSYPNTPFAQYRQGYAMQGARAPSIPQFRTAGQAQPYYNNANNPYPARWNQLAVNWRI
jgi:hypothetical protein